MLDILKDDDWKEAFEYAGADRGDVAEILHINEGENAEEPWLLIGRLHSGKVLGLKASCDYTGWG